MRFKIEHEIRGRVRLHICQKRMTCRQADQLEYFLTKLNGVISVKVVERNQDVVICYSDNREEMTAVMLKTGMQPDKISEQLAQNIIKGLRRKY